MLTSENIKKNYTKNQNGLIVCFWFDIYAYFLFFYFVFVCFSFQKLVHSHFLFLSLDCSWAD